MRNCGWCASSGSCLEGTSASPSRAVCSTWQFASCPGLALTASAFVDASQSSLTLQFDLDMAQRAPQPCAQYTATPLGSPAASLLCVWRNSRQLSMQLGFGLASPLISLDITAGVTNGLLRSISGDAPSATTLAAARAAQVPQAAVVQLSGPELVASCATSFTLSASCSAGLSLFTTPVFTWSAAPSTPAIAAAITAAAGGPTLVVSPTDLIAGTPYVFSVSVAGVSASHTLQLSTAPQRVAVAITAPSSVAMYGWSELILVAEVATCGGAAPTGTYTYAWTKINGPDVVLDRATQVTNTYRIAPNALVAGVYQFQVGVDLDDKLDTVGRATVTVTVLPSPLVALPSGQQVDTRLRNVRLNGAESQDADRSSGTPSYAWGCSELAFPANPCVVSSLASSAVANTTGLLEFPAANLAPGPWSFSLVFSKGAQRARAFQTVVVDWNEAPSGRVQLRDPSRLQVRGVGSPASATNIVNAREPLVLYAADVEVAALSHLQTWLWQSPLSSLNLATTAQGTRGAFLFVPPGTLAPGAGYGLTALVVDSAGRNSTLAVSITVNDEPRAVLPGSGCFFSSPVPAVVQTLSTVLSVTCRGWIDDSSHYPLGYLFRAGNFLVSSGFVAGSSVDFVLSSATDSAVTVRVSDSLGAWNGELAVPYPSGTTFASTIPLNGNAGEVAVAAASAVSGALAQAVQIGSVERIDQVAQGIMLGITQPLSTVSAAQLQQLRSIWTDVSNVVDKYVVQQPTLLWIQQQGTKLAAWTRSAQLLDAVLQNVSLTTAQAMFRLQPAGTAETGQRWIGVFNNWVSAIGSQAIVANLSSVVSTRFLNATREFLGAQISGGAAVPQSTVTASYAGARISMYARLDSFGTVFSPAGPRSLPASQPLALSLAVPHAGRQHSFTLSTEAAKQIDAANSQYHGMEAWATDVDIFRWSSQPPLAFASDVVMLRVSQPVGNAEIIVRASVLVTLQRTADASQPAGNSTMLACARWSEEAQLWTEQGCSKVSSSDSTVVCDCNTAGVFAAVWAPFAGEGAVVAPLLPLGPAPGFGVLWLPIAAALILLFLMGLLILLYCCYRRKAPARSVPLAASALVARAEMPSLDEWSTHLKRPARMHKPGVMPPDTHVVYYEQTSSGEDDWPADDQPNKALLEAPLMPRVERAPFVGGRVALVRDEGQMFEGEGAILAPQSNAFDRFAVPYSDEQRRYDRQLGRDARQSDYYSSEEGVKKLK